MRRIRLFLFALILAVSCFGSPIIAAQEAPKSANASTKFEISFPASLHASPITGRMFLFIAKDSSNEPRLQNPAILVGADVKAEQPGELAIIDGTMPGYPAHNLSEIPPGDYYVQAMLNVYTEFHRADGHVIWAHMDQWEGQHFFRSPGNLISEPQKLHLDSSIGYRFRIQLQKTLLPIEVPADTEWVKHIKFQSKLLSQFWGHPIYIGATILLPKGYDTHPDVHYPVIYLQGHFSLQAPFGFTTAPDEPGAKSWAELRKEWASKYLVNMPEPPPGTKYNGALMDVESGYQFYQAWNSDDFPRMIAVTFQIQPRTSMIRMAPTLLMPDLTATPS